jgi:hypothetical protein
MARIKILEAGQSPNTLPTFEYTQGIWVRFAGQDVEGWAMFMHGTTLSISNIEGHEFYVETGYENVQNISRVDDAVPESITPLLTEGDFLVQATVKDVADDGVIFCSASDFNFMIQVSIEIKSQLMAGAKLSMEVDGLILWDMNA